MSDFLCSTSSTHRLCTGSGRHGIRLPSIVYINGCTTWLNLRVKCPCAIRLILWCIYELLMLVSSQDDRWMSTLLSLIFWGKCTPYKWACSSINEDFCCIEKCTCLFNSDFSRRAHRQLMRPFCQQIAGWFITVVIHIILSYDFPLAIL